MQVPARTTKIDPTHVLLAIILVCAIPLYVLWPSSSQEPCMSDIIPFWNGEYPEPVVVVRDKTSHMAYADLCLEETFSCTILPGMVHPWAKENIRYASKPEMVLYRSSVDFSSSLQDYSLGTELVYEGKTPDGMCSFRVDTDRWYTSCAFLEQLVYVSGKQGTKARQFFFTACAESRSGWVEVDETLFSNIGIDRGLIKGYGVIASE